MTRCRATSQVGWERYLKSQSGRGHVRHPDEYPGRSVIRLSCHAMVFWCAMGGEGSLAQYRICRSHPALFFSNIVLGFMWCLWAGRDSHLCAGADLDCFGVTYRHFGGVRLLQIRALISARPRTLPLLASGNAFDSLHVLEMKGTAVFIRRGVAPKYPIRVKARLQVKLDVRARTQRVLLGLFR